MTDFVFKYDRFQIELGLKMSKKLPGSKIFRKRVQNFSKFIWVQKCQRMGLKCQRILLMIKLFSVSEIIRRQNFFRISEIEKTKNYFFGKWFSKYREHFLASKL